MQSEINTLLINRVKYSIFLCIYLGGLILASVLISIDLRTIVPFYFCAGLPIIILLILEKKVRNYFTKKASILLFDDKLTIKLFDRKTDELYNAQEFEFCEINSFRAQDSSKDDSFVLNINLVNGKKFSYIFLGQGMGKGEINFTDVLFNSINNYNRKQEQHKINLIPNFFASKTGRVSIFFLSFLLIVSIIIQIMYKPQTLLLSIIPGASLFLIILIQSRKDKQMMRRLK